MSNKLVSRKTIGNECIGGTKRAPRVCPMCGKRFPPMSDVLWKNAIAIHLITSKQDKLKQCPLW